MFKYIFTALFVFTAIPAISSDWDKVDRAAKKASNDIQKATEVALEQAERASEVALDQAKRAANRADDDIKEIIDENTPGTKRLLKRVEVNSLRVLQSIEDGVRHFGREVREEFQDEQNPNNTQSTEQLAPVVITTNNLTLLRGLQDTNNVKLGAYYYSADGQTSNQIIPLPKDTSLKVVPTSTEDAQFATDAVTALNKEGEAQYCVDTSSFEIADSSETIAVHVFSECSFQE